jgi:O-antigen/teichoic acid export membrane protein
MQLKKKVLHAVSWTVLSRIITQGTIFIRLIILARLLTPQDFGIFAIVTTTLNILETLTETGFNYAAIQMQINLQVYGKSLWIVNIVRGLLLAVFTLVISNFIVIFFKIPNIWLLLSIAAAIPLIKGFQNPFTLIFMRDMDFFKDSVYRLVPIVIGSVVTIFLAFLYHNVNSLIFGILSEALSMTAFSFIIIKADFQEDFSLKYIHKLFSYGKWMTLGGISTYLMTQIDNLFVGKFFGTAALGLYDSAFKLANISFTEITDILSRIMFPTYSIIQLEKHRVRWIFIRHTAIVTIPAFFIMIVTFFYADLIIKIILGNQWVKAANLLQILSVYGFVRSFVGPIGPLLLSMGKPKELSIANILNLFLIIVLIYPFSTFWGLKGVAIAVLTSYIITVPYLLYFVWKDFKSK